MIKLLVLELLSQRNMSGYQMKQILEKTDAKRWGGVLPGSIYNAIKKLEKEGAIALAHVAMTGNRQRSEYKITADGRKQEHELIIQALSAPIQFNGDLYSGIGFAYQLEKEQAITILQKNITQLKQEKAEISHGKSIKEAALKTTLPPLSALVIEHMLQSIALQINLIEQVIKELEGDNLTE